MTCFCRQKGAGVILTSTKSLSIFHPPAIGKKLEVLTSSPFHSLLYHHKLPPNTVPGNFLNHSFWIVTLYRRFYVFTLPSIQRLLLSLPWLAVKQQRERWASGYDCVRPNLSTKLSCCFTQGIPRSMLILKPNLRSLTWEEWYYHFSLCEKTKLFLIGNFIMQQIATNEVRIRRYT